jgi:hypothetical protein
MKSLSCCLLALALIALPVGVLAEDTSRKTILDYYLSMETNDQEGPRFDERQQRLDDVDKKDIRNGYLLLKSDGVRSTEMKLFHLSDGSDLVARAFTGCCCEGTCDRRIQFFAAKDGTLVDVTQTVWPLADLEEIRKVVAKRLKKSERWMAADIADGAIYKLSRTSDTILVGDGARPILRFKLKNDKFVRF